MPNISQKQTTYLFVDGANFRKYFNEITQKWFGQEVEFDFKKIKEFFKAEKAFYYDCVDDIKTDNENQDSFAERVKTQEEKLNKIREVEGCHVHLGSLSGKGKKKRQKEVDVLLAVQMMEHAFRGNMSRAIIISGDKDFRPLVESLVRLGLFVQAVGDKNHISDDLIHSADFHKKLCIDEYYQWTVSDYHNQNPIAFPHLSFFAEQAKDKFYLKKKGKWNNAEISVFMSSIYEGYWFTTSLDIHKDSAWVSSDLEQLELYFTLKYGQITWDKLT